MASKELILTIGVVRAVTDFSYKLSCVDSERLIFFSLAKDAVATLNAWGVDV